ncbi:hypothetical protein [Allocoleopsis franciscana]|uniref:hypothetical protein n=1 Tax=Allocoleopsis franciscana TaxID=2886352 RepID=UPI0005A1ABA8|nr:hypothetical protein [Allocoleopsis franciscana]
MRSLPAEAPELLILQRLEAVACSKEAEHLGLDFGQRQIAWRLTDANSSRGAATQIFRIDDKGG